MLDWAAFVAALAEKKIEERNQCHAVCCYTTANNEPVTEDKFGKSVAAAETSGDNGSLHLFLWTE